MLTAETHVIPDRLVCDASLLLAHDRAPRTTQGILCVSCPVCNKGVSTLVVVSGALLSQAHVIRLPQRALLHALVHEGMS